MREDNYDGQGKSQVQETEDSVRMLGLSLLVLGTVLLVSLTLCAAWTLELF